MQYAMFVCRSTTQSGSHSMNFHNAASRGWVTVARSGGGVTWQKGREHRGVSGSVTSAPSRRPCCSTNRAAYPSFPSPSFTPTSSASPTHPNLLHPPLPPPIPALTLTPCPEVMPGLIKNFWSHFSCPFLLHLLLFSNYIFYAPSPLLPSLPTQH